MISATEAPYQSCYCEENVYKLFEKIRDLDGEGNLNLEDFWAVMISNDDKMIPLWAQKAAREPGLYVLWDYHVIVISKSTSESSSSSKVFDLDSVLGWGVDFETYWNETMNPEKMQKVQTKYRRKFRLIPAHIYLRLLSSDRSHMLDANGKYLKPPPTWPKILQDSTRSNLMDLIDMSLQFPGTQVMEEKVMEEFFGKS